MFEYYHSYIEINFYPKLTNKHKILVFIREFCFQIKIYFLAKRLKFILDLLMLIDHI